MAILTNNMESCFKKKEQLSIKWLLLSHIEIQNVASS